MRTIFLLVLLLATSLFSWGQDYDFSKVDATVTFYSDQFRTTQEVSNQIKQDFSQPQDQLRAAYTWIIRNIAYDPEEYLTYQFQYRELAERDSKLASTREDIIKRTMYGKTAVCEGYALALERICEELGINAYVVRGDVKRDVTDIGRPFEKNHMWLIAIVNQKPVIMDPTWGAGRFIESFQREPSYAFYDVKPEHFLKTHYPEVFDDTYVDVPISQDSFSKWPLIIPENVQLDDIQPKNGILKYKDLKNGIDFSLSVKPEKTLLYTFDDGVMREAKIVKEGDALSFFIRTKSRTSRVVIFDGNKPLVAYLVN